MGWEPHNLAGPSRKTYTYLYGMRSCSIPQTSNLNISFSDPMKPFLAWWKLVCTWIYFCFQNFILPINAVKQNEELPFIESWGFSLFLLNLHCFLCWKKVFSYYNLFGWYLGFNLFLACYQEGTIFPLVYWFVLGYALRLTNMNVSRITFSHNVYHM